MTDISRWHELVQAVKLRFNKQLDGSWQDGPNGEPIFSDYVLLPFNEYQLSNLMAMLARAEDTGDWYWELISLCLVAMDKAGIKELTSNLGDCWTLEDIKSGEFISKTPRPGTMISLLRQWLVLAEGRRLPDEAGIEALVKETKKLLDGVQ